jgi:hypothetical protein
MQIQLVGTLRFAHPAILNPKGGRGDRVRLAIETGLLHQVLLKIPDRHFHVLHRGERHHSGVRDSSG